MGYDCKLVVMKRSVLTKWQEEFPKKPLSELYFDVLSCYEDSEEFDIKESEMSREIFYSSTRVFPAIYDVLDGVPNDGVYVFSKEEYETMVKDMSALLESITLHDVAVEQLPIDFPLVGAYVSAFKSLFGADIDWESEVLLFEHDW